MEQIKNKYPTAQQVVTNLKLTIKVKMQSSTLTQIQNQYLHPKPHTIGVGCGFASG